MLILISPAKTMSSNFKSEAPNTSLPIYDAYAKEIARIISSYSIEELINTFNISKQQASINYERYKSFLEADSKDNKEKPAILQYDGVVFKHLLKEQFTKGDFTFAQKHLRITSFMYGLLRPLDLIKPYRMEGSVKLNGFGGKSLFDFWGDKLTNPLLEDTKETGGVLINLASSEMKKLFQWNRLEQEIELITPEFRIYKNGVPKNIATYSKMARGEMARYIICNQILSPDDLKSFQWEGFCYDEQLSLEKKPVFSKSGD